MVILAVVIIISLIVAAILGQFPALGGSTRSRTASVYWQSTPIGIVSYSIAEGGASDDAVLTLRNNRKDTVTVTDIMFDGTSIHSNDIVIAPGEKSLLSIDDVGNFCLNAGDSYTIDINITYLDDETGESFSMAGAGQQKLEGKCAN